MDNMDFINNENLSILITGDSLAHNRYDFDPVARANAYDCYPGMPSWSFLVRDALYQNDSWYTFGDELQITGYSFVAGNMNEDADQLKYSCANHGKAVTIKFNNEAKGYIKFKHTNKNSSKAILYLQKRPDQYSCKFDLYLDDLLCIPDIDSSGDIEYYRGWEVYSLELPIPGDGIEHKISFRNLRSNLSLEKRITICGIGTRKINVNLTGSGSKTSQFFYENIDERILRFSPDFMIFIIGANDRIYLSPDDFKKYLELLFTKIKDYNPAIKMLVISPPSSQHSEILDDSKKPQYISDKSSMVYNNILKEVTEKYNHKYLDLIELFRIYSYDYWRFDNIHLTKAGNEILAKKVLELLMPEDKYRREMVNSTWWSE